jgi:hypothetical protein
LAKKEREKGKRGEREVVKLLKEAGFEARRTAPLQAGETSGDPDVELDNKYRIEVKRRKNGFEQLYKWLKNTDFLFVRADRKDYIVSMSLQTFLELYSAAKKEV